MEMQKWNEYEKERRNEKKYIKMLGNKIVKYKINEDILKNAS